MPYIQQHIPDNKSVLAFKISNLHYERVLEEVSVEFIHSIDKTKLLDEEYIKDIFLDLYSKSCDLLKQKIHSVKSADFYKLLILLHDFSIEAYHAKFIKHNNIRFSSNFTEQDFALSRRILKFLIEESVNVEMTFIQEPKDKKSFTSKYEEHLDVLFGYSSLIYQLAELISELSMGVKGILIELKGSKIYPSRTGKLNNAIDVLTKEVSSKQMRHAIDTSSISGMMDMKMAVIQCLEIDYDNAGNVIAGIHEGLPEKDFGLFGWHSLVYSLETFGYDFESCELFFRGLTLDKSNKLDLKEIPLKPKNLNRYFYRPILIWTINGTEYAIVTKKKYTESIMQLPVDTIPWGKAPIEWLSKNCFREYVSRKEDAHDKWLDDLVEEGVKKEKLIYDRNVISIRGSNLSIRLDKMNVGEIDFIVLNAQLNVIFIIDCKNLQGRYDMVSYRDDYSKFTGKKGYNEKLKNKVEWAKSNLNLLSQHFGQGSVQKDLTNYKVNGLFILNTPTFYQYMKTEYTLTSIHDFLDIILGKTQSIKVIE